MKKINCILLIDDNEGDNFYHKLIISEAEVCNEIKVVTDGIQALDYLAKCADAKLTDSYPKPDLIYLDINMPKMNGYEFLEEYKKLDEHVKSKVVIIMLTTSINPDDRERALSSKEVTEFQNKPLSVELLHATVEKYF